MEAIKEKFENLYKSEPKVFRSPGRVNLIGEHTDYNNGFVLPASVSKAIHFAISPNSNGEYRFYAYDLDEEHRTPFGEVKKGQVHWANYLIGVIAQFKKLGVEVPGFDCVFGGNVPLGAGMSSSAALECGLAFAINEIFEYNFSTLELVKMAQKAEHEYAGVQCGIMDQFAVMHGKTDHVIMLDCKSLEFKYFPLNMSDHLLILVNTGVKHSLASSEYNVRRKECEEGVNILKKFYPEIKSLRDVSLKMIEERRCELKKEVYNRCSYVVEENIRLQEACEKLLEGDLESFGMFMYGSHDGLKNKYEVSCPELDRLVDIARCFDGVLGARMMGGGFGGCTINLVEKDKVDAFKETIIKNYRTPEGLKPQIIEVEIMDGTKQISN